MDIKYDKYVTNMPEISVLYSLIKTLSNPKDDISFIATLRNIYGLSDSELLVIANSGNVRRDKVQFYDVAKNCNDKDLKKKIDGIIANLDKYRFLAQNKETSDILYDICVENGYFNRLLQMEDGLNIKNRVEEYILSLKGKEIVSNVFKFAGAIDEDRTQLNILGTGNGIKLRTIHASKGLEYPVVILSDAGKAFRGPGDSIHLDRDLGVGYNYYNHNKKVFAETIVKKAIKNNKYKSEQEEELRLLYVALTRARNKLIILGKDVPGTDGLLYPVRTATNFMTWIKLGASKAEVTKCINEVNFEEIKTDENVKMDNALYNRLKNQLEYKYDFKEDIEKLKKATVTSFNKHDPLDTEYIPTLFSNNEESIERGNAYHKFMQYVDFTRPILEQIKKLHNDNILSDEEFSLLDEDQINKILSNDIFKEVKKSTYYREQPFVLRNDNGQLIQGIIDMFYIKDNKIYLVDYKYSSRSDKALIETYTPQLMLYRKAIEEILKMPVEKTMLLNLSNGHVLEL